MDWKQIYQDRTVDVREAVGMIQSKDEIFLGHAAAEPRYLVKKLLERKDELKGVRLVQGLNIGDAPYAAPEYEGHFIVETFFAANGNRQCLQEGRGALLPMHFYAQPRAIREGRVGCDVALISCTPPDEAGYVNMGLSCDQTRVIVEKARLTIAQVNKRMPYVCGDTMIHVSEIDRFVCHDEEPYQIPLLDRDDPVAEKIGYNISTLIRDGDTIQMGQGTIPNAILKFLTDKKDLGIHTEVFSDNVLPLIKSGVINGAAKTLHNRKIVATFIQGTRDLYDFVDHNNMIRLFPVDYTNSVGVISRNDNMVAICSALQVDLMGQVNADYMGSTVFSGVGGQLDYMRGAEEAKNGRPIIALPSTAKKGTVSRIVAQFEAGTPVTASRHEVHYIVTEYGAAEIFGLTLRERARVLIDIAHPDFREQLEREFDDYLRKAGMKNGFTIV